MMMSEPKLTLDELRAVTEKAGRLRYPSNVLEGFGSGALLDLRARLAADFLKHSPMFGHLSSNAPTERERAAEMSGFALMLADELLTQAEARGWVEPLPDDNGDLPPSLRAQARRTASFQALQQMEAQRFAQDEQARVVPMVPQVRPNGRAN